MTRIKLCGLGRKEDIICANSLLPDYIGFVFAKGSRRYVDAPKAAELKAVCDDRIKTAGVFVDADEDYIISLVRDGIIDTVQLHGSEDDDCIRRLRSLGVREIIKAFKIASAEDIEKARRSAADYVLLDSGCGGGEVFDWELIGQIDRPYFLAGGLNCENVANAIERLAPYAVDVSSGIETDGVKDTDKMRMFVTRARNAATLG